MKKNGTMSSLFIFNNPYQEFFKKSVEDTLEDLKSTIRSILESNVVDCFLLSKYIDLYVDILEMSRGYGIDVEKYAKEIFDIFLRIK